MVDEQLARRGITDARVLEAMRRIPRHRFVEEGLAPAAARGPARRGRTYGVARGHGRGPGPDGDRASRWRDSLASGGRLQVREARGKVRLGVMTVGNLYNGRGHSGRSAAW